MLPLKEFFYRLRDHGLPLGIAEYTAVLQALQAGVGLSDQNALRKLCMVLWVKSDEEKLLFNRLFDEMLVQPATAVTESPEVDLPEVQKEPSIEEEPANLNPELVRKSSTNEMEKPESVHSMNRPSQNISLQTSEPSQIVQAIQHGQQHQNFTRPKYSMVNDYFPVTRRQMKQSWRYLRRPVREGPLVELDIEATIEKISQDGMFREPVLRPRRMNKAEVALLVDQDGSMVPFHVLSRQLIETILRGGRLQQTPIYYFHDYPTEYLYLEPARLQARQISNVLMNFNTFTAVLVISDAGAARGHLDSGRVSQTGFFLQKLAQYVRRFAWINPLPNPRWANTTAGEIARLVPMFDMSRRGLDDAINTLRGRYIYSEKSYPWMT